MADNYLENKYAEYQARKTSGTRTGHTTKTLHKTRRVFITGGAEGIGKAIVRLSEEPDIVWPSATRTRP